MGIKDTNGDEKCFVKRKQKKRMKKETKNYLFSWKRTKRVVYDVSISCMNRDMYTIRNLPSVAAAAEVISQHKRTIPPILRKAVIEKTNAKKEESKKA